jgi:hypothetical protein
VKLGDTPRADQKEGSFASDFWANGEKTSFRYSVIEGMASRPNRGRGRGRGGREEQ